MAVHRRRSSQSNGNQENGPLVANGNKHVESGSGDAQNFTPKKEIADLVASIPQTEFTDHLEHDVRSSFEEEEEEETIVPDGGWGWVVCFGSFLVNFILDGTMFSFGVMLLYLLDDFGQVKATTAWVGSAQMGVHMCMGPVISALLKRYTIRQVTITGAVIASTSFVISIFSPNVYVLIVTFGIFGGIGFGLMFLPAIIVVGLYFNHKRALATGIATSGSGVGTFVYAYLTESLLETYGWRGTVLILGGILLHCAVCGLLFRPLFTVAAKGKKSKFPSEKSGGKLVGPLDDHSMSSGYSTLPEHDFGKQAVAAVKDNISINASGDQPTEAMKHVANKADIVKIEPNGMGSLAKQADCEENRNRIPCDSAETEAFIDTNVQVIEGASQLSLKETKGPDLNVNQVSLLDSFANIQVGVVDSVVVVSDDMYCECEDARSSDIHVADNDANSDISAVDFDIEPLLLLKHKAKVAVEDARSRSASFGQCHMPSCSLRRSPVKRASVSSRTSFKRVGSLKQNEASRSNITHKKVKLAWIFKDSWQGKFGFKLKPVGRLYKSVDHIDPSPSNDDFLIKQVTSPDHITLRLLSSEYKLNDFAASRAMSLFGVRTPRVHTVSESNNPNEIIRHGSKSELQAHVYKGLLQPIRRKDIYYSGSVNQLPAYKQYGGSLTTFLAAMTRASSEEEDAISTRTRDKGVNDGGFCARVNSVLPMKLLKNTSFLLLLVTFTMWTAQSVSITYLPDLAVSLDISRHDAAFLISVVGIANCCGRPIAGFVTDFFRVPAILLYIVALLVAACVNLAIPFCDSYNVLIGCSAIFGLCMAVAVSMRTIVLAEQLGIEVLTESFGVVALFQGVAFTVNPPIAGKLIDTFNSFKPPFIMAASMYAISAICAILVACISGVRRKPLSEKVVNCEIDIEADDDVAQKV